jgi:hypothetical protein
MIEERLKLSSRRSYSRHIQSMNRDGDGKIFKCDRAEAETFNQSSEKLKKAKERLEGLSNSLQHIK